MRNKYFAFLFVSASNLSSVSVSIPWSNPVRYPLKLPEYENVASFFSFFRSVGSAENPTKTRLY